MLIIGSFILGLIIIAGLIVFDNLKADKLKKEKESENALTELLNEGKTLRSQIKVKYNDINIDEFDSKLANKLEVTLVEYNVDSFLSRLNLTEDDIYTNINLMYVIAEKVGLLNTWKINDLVEELR